MNENTKHLHTHEERESLKRNTFIIPHAFTPPYFIYYFELFSLHTDSSTNKISDFEMFIEQNCLGIAGRLHKLVSLLWILKFWILFFKHDFTVMNIKFVKTKIRTISKFEFSVVAASALDTQRHFFATKISRSIKQQQRQWQQHHIWHSNYYFH